MAKARISAHVDKAKRPPQPYLAVKVGELDDREFEKVKEWFKKEDSYVYNCVPPEENKTGMLTASFDDVEDARRFVEFLASEIGVPYTIDAMFAEKVTKISTYKAGR